MSRYFVLVAAAAIAIAVASLPVSVAGQSPAAAAKKWSAPRTPDGQPDLQGIWSFATITPLERPSELAGKQELTDRGSGGPARASRSEPHRSSSR